MKYYKVYSKRAYPEGRVELLSQQQAYRELSAAIDTESMHVMDDDGPFDEEKAEEMAIQLLESKGIFEMSKSAIMKSDMIPEASADFYGWDAVILYDAAIEIDYEELTNIMSYDEFLAITGISSDEFLEGEYLDFLDENVSYGEACNADEFEEIYGLSVEREKFETVRERIKKMCEEVDW